MKICSLILGVILCFCTLAQEDSPVLLGSWTATAAPNQIFGGAWSAQASLHNPNRALGSWTLINEAGDVILEGMWSAEIGPAVAGNVDSSTDEGTIALGLGPLMLRA
jgi:hypothetical protein